MKKLPGFFLLVCITTSVFSQDSLMRKNCISYAPTSMANRTLSISYYRVIKQDFEVCIKPGIRIASEFADGNNVDLPFVSIVEDPFWYYNRFTTYVGFMRNHYNMFLEQTKNNVFYEPTLQYEYGYFKDKTLVMVNSIGENEDDFWRLDRKYHAVGCMIFTGICYDFDRFRFKLIGGLGYSLRFYQQNVHEKWKWTHNTYYTNTDNTITKYTKNHVTFKIGIELGFKL